MRWECRERFPCYRLQTKQLVSDPDMHHGMCVTARAVMHVGIANPWWRGKRSRHSRRMRNPQFYVSGKRSIGRFVGTWHDVISAEPLVSAPTYTHGNAFSLFIAMGKSWSCQVYIRNFQVVTWRVTKQQPTDVGWLIRQHMYHVITFNNNSKLIRKSDVSIQGEGMPLLRCSEIYGVNHVKSSFLMFTLYICPYQWQKLIKLSFNKQYTPITR